ncbi:MAG TPA: hypothetical protein VFS97_11570 [Nitrososphaeraceae archaeon]|nr:hypothetical protein [Nitrososphaeraceae archaeon]
MLTTTALTTIVPAAYAGGDHDGGDGNKNKAEDDSAAALADCDDNDVEQAGFDCFGIAANDIDADIGGLLGELGPLTAEDAVTATTETP